MDNPARYAAQLLRRSALPLSIKKLQLQLCRPLPPLTCFIRFQKCAEENGIVHAPIELLHGDFLKSAAVKDAISSAGLVFMNNPSFGPELNLKVLSEALSRPSPGKKICASEVFYTCLQMNSAPSCPRAVK
jgi:hypothetical protein